MFISSGEAEEPSEGTGREVGCWAGLGHSSGIESELASLTSDSTSEQCLLSPERTEGWHESDWEDSPASALCTVKIHMHTQWHWYFCNYVWWWIVLQFSAATLVFFNQQSREAWPLALALFIICSTSTRVVVNQLQKQLLATPPSNLTCMQATPIKR